MARIRATLRAALNAALRQGLVGMNPACRVEMPPARRPKAVVWTSARVQEWQRTGQRPAVWTAGQTAQFLHAIGSHRLCAAYHLVALRGLRRGEAAGLRWCDVDLDAGVATISQQLQQYGGHLVVGAAEDGPQCEDDRAGPYDGGGAAPAPAPAGAGAAGSGGLVQGERVRVHRGAG